MTNSKISQVNRFVNNSIKPVKQILNTKTHFQTPSRPWWESCAQETKRSFKERELEGGRILTAMVIPVI